MSIRPALAALALVSLAACGGGPQSPSPPRVEGAFLTATSAHFTIRYTAIDDGTLADITATLEREHARITSDLSVSDMPAVTVTLYPSSDSFRAAVTPLVGTVPAFATGLVTGVSAVHMVSPNAAATRSYAAAVTGIVHEFAHCVSLRVNGGFGNNPRWLWEAVALYEAGQFTDARAIAAAVDRSPPTIAQLNSFDNTIIYDVGASLGDFIVRTWGRDALIALIRSNGSTTQVLGLSDTQLLARWMDAISRA